MSDTLPDDYDIEVPLLRQVPGYDLTPGPWLPNNEGVLLGADGSMVLLMGCHEEPLSDQNITDGAFVQSVPAMVSLVRFIARFHVTANRQDTTETLHELVKRATAIQASWSGC